MNKKMLVNIRAMKKGQSLLSRLHGGFQVVISPTVSPEVQSLHLILKAAWRLPGGHCSQLRVQTLDLILEAAWRLPGGHCSQLRVQTLHLILKAA
jgi:hypothetical protein